MQLNRYLAFRKESIAGCMRYSDADERWGGLVIIRSRVTLMTSKFLLALQNLIALLPGNEQWMAGKVLRRAEIIPLHRDSPQWPFERLTICLFQLTFGGLWLFSQPQKIWKLDLFSIYRVHVSPGGSHPLSTQLRLRHMPDRRGHPTLITHSKLIEMRGSIRRVLVFYEVPFVNTWS